MRTDSFNIFLFLRRVSTLLQIFLLIGLTIQPAWATSNSFFQTKLAANAPVHFPLEEESSVPLNNTSEESNPGGFSFTDEYLHNNQSTEANVEMLLTEFHFCADQLYQAYHGEQLIPPPDRF